MPQLADATYAHTLVRSFQLGLVLKARPFHILYLTWKDQNLGRKVEVKYVNVPCNAC